MRYVLLVLLASSARAACPAFWPSVAASSAAHAADILSSRGMIEQNSVLGKGPFGWPQAGRKIALATTFVGVETVLLRKRPSLCQALVTFNVVMAGGTGFVVGVNLKRRAR